METQMRTQFELEWLGGPAASLFRRRRPSADDLPWGSIEPSKFSPAALLEARKIWTNGTFTEYASGAAFSAMATTFFECGAPIDLCAAAADFAVDEMSHAEMAARLVMEFGGAVPYETDLSKVSPLLRSELSPLMRAATLVIKTSSVGEALSVPILARSMRETEVPLVHEILHRLSHDEGPHSAMSDWFFEWANEKLTDVERDVLATTALDAIEIYSPLWKVEPCDSCRPNPDLGGLPHESYRATMINAIRTRIAKPLARHQIQIDGQRLEDLLALVSSE
jgi:hypothetical protein